MAKLPQNVRPGGIATLTTRRGSNSATFRVRIEDITVDEVISVGQPTQGGKPVVFTRSEPVGMMVQTEGIKVTIQGEFVKTETEDDLVLVLIKVLGVETEQRRAFHRLPIRIEVTGVWYWKGRGNPVAAGIQVGSPATANAHEVDFDESDPDDRHQDKPVHATAHVVAPSPTPAASAFLTLGPRPPAPVAGVTPPPAPKAEPVAEVKEPEKPKVDENAVEGIWVQLDDVEVCDYSGGGIAFITHRPLPMSTWMSATYPLPVDMGPITVTGQVRSMRRRSVEGRNRTYIVGIQYTKLERSDQDRVVRSIFKYELEKARKASGL